MANATKRIGYIDALRGFTMILVVFSHIYLPNVTPLNQFLVNFRMPLFFFISGFISFRMAQSWSGKETLSRLGSKVRTMIIPALVIGLTYTIINGGVDISYFFTHDRKMGYWFTFALFNMLTIYYSARWIHARRGKTSLNIFAKRLYLLGIIFFIAFSDMSMLGDMGNIFTLGLTFKYFHFFAFGAVCSCNREWFERIFESGAKMTIVVVGLFVLSWFVITLRGNSDIITAYVNPRVYELARALLRAYIGYFGIITVYGFFRRFGEFFSESKIGKSLQFVGRNTLDVYLLHYFVLLGMPTMLRPYIVDTTNLLMPLVVGMAVATAIVAVSLLISRILRLSDYVAYYLLGARDVTLKPKNRESK